EALQRRCRPAAPRAGASARDWGGASNNPDKVQWVGLWTANSRWDRLNALRLAKPRVRRDHRPRPRIRRAAGAGQGPRFRDLAGWRGQVGVVQPQEQAL